MKELLYDEIFFCSSEECNDPFDGKTFYQFDRDVERWSRLLEFSWRFLGDEATKQLAQKLAPRIADECPMTYEEAMNFDFTRPIQECVDGTMMGLVTELSSSIRYFLKLFSPFPSYFVSFSSIGNDPLMWSHYAGKHQGWCLIFKSIDRALWQDPTWKKTNFRRDTPNGIAPTMSFEVPESFPFQNINYVSEVKHLDAFTRFPVPVYGKSLTDEEKDELASAQQAQYLQKHEDWAYEKEARLMLPPAYMPLAGERIEYSPQERLFHFNGDQLVGIVFGARISETNKIKVLDTLSERLTLQKARRDRQRTVFPFMIFQAQLSLEARELRVEPEQAWTLNDVYRPGDDQFGNTYSQWKNGDALVFKAQGGSHKQRFPE